MIDKDRHSAIKCFKEGLYDNNKWVVGYSITGFELLNIQFEFNSQIDDQQIFWWLGCYRRKCSLAEFAKTANWRE